MSSETRKGRKVTTHKRNGLIPVTEYMEWLGLRKQRTLRNTRKSAKRARARLADDGERFIPSRATHLLHQRRRKARRGR